MWKNSEWDHVLCKNFWNQPSHFLPIRKLPCPVLPVLIAWLNLDLEIKTCFIDGLNPCYIVCMGIRRKHTRSVPFMCTHPFVPSSCHCILVSMAPIHITEIICFVTLMYTVVSGKAVTMHQPWLTIALMKWNAMHVHHHGYGAGRHYVCHNCSCWVWKRLQLLLSTRTDSAEDDELQ